MIKSIVYATAASCLLVIAPATVLPVMAAGSAFDQEKSTEANNAYKALSLGENRFDQADEVGIMPQRETTRSPSVLGNQAPNNSTPMYAPLRGGREY